MDLRSRDSVPASILLYLDKVSILSSTAPETSQWLRHICGGAKWGEGGGGGGGGMSVLSSTIPEASQSLRHVCVCVCGGGGVCPVLNCS